MPFKKAEPKQSYIKIGIYGKQGSGKTVTSLLFAEGLAKKSKKRIAYVDTEGGTDFYARDIPERKFHPKKFDFDAIYTRSLQEVLDECKSIDFNTYNVIVVDSITHLWEAAQNAYEGKKVGTNKDKIPLYAWADIKRPFKELVNFLMNCPAHVFICGREGVEMADVDGENQVVGSKIKAEGETGYEPNILINMKQQRYTDVTDGVERGDIVAYFEKDRSGLYTGKSIKYPTFKTIEPLVNLLNGDEQRHIDSTDEQIEKDSSLIDSKRLEKEKVSKELRVEYAAKLSKSATLDELIAVWKEINGTPKKKMYKDDFDHLIQIKDELKTVLAEKNLEVK